jgi:hypothetical protein
VVFFLLLFLSGNSLALRNVYGTFFHTSKEAKKINILEDDIRK